MHNINSDTELRAAILQLEKEQDEEMRILKEQFHLAYESVKPINLIKSTFKQVTASRELTDNIVSTVVGLSAGYLSKMIFEKVSDSPFKRLLGVALQFGITTVVAKNPEVVRMVGNGIWAIVSSLSGNDDAEDEKDDQ